MQLHELYLSAIIVVSGLLVAISIYAWNQRHLPGIKAYIGMNLFGLLISLTFYGAVTTQSQEIGYMWVRLRFIAYAVVPMLGVTFVMHFVRRPPWVSRWLMISLWAVTVLTTILMVVPGLDRYFFESWALVRLDGYSVEERVYAPLYYLWMAQQFVVMPLGMFILIDYVVRVNSSRRSSLKWIVPPMLLMLIVPNLPITIGPPPGLRPMPLLTGLVALSTGWTFLRHRLLSVMPVAYDRIIECVQDGVLVLNHERLIISSNAASTRMFGNKLLVNQIADVLGLPKDVPLTDGAPYSAEFEHNGLTLQGQSLPLTHNGRVIGRTLVLRDLTARKQAELEARELTYERERSRLMNQFLRETSSEFNTPIAAIRKALGGLREPDTEKRAPHSVLIEGYIDKMTRQMQEVRKMSTGRPDEPNLLNTPEPEPSSIPPQTAQAASP